MPRLTVVTANQLRQRLMLWNAMYARWRRLQPSMSNLIFPDIDHVSLGEGLDIPKQSIGVASKADGMNGIDGILGIGPIDLTQGSGRIFTIL